MTLEEYKALKKAIKKQIWMEYNDGNVLPGFKIIPPPKLDLKNFSSATAIVFQTQYSYLGGE